MEDGVITVSRAAGSLTFPARFILLASANLCPCGYLGHPKRSCQCLPGAIMKYRKRLSGPLMDRIDMHVDVPPVAEEKLTGEWASESSDIIRERVVAARKRQQERFRGQTTMTNGEMSVSDIRKNCRLTASAQNLLKQAISKMTLSARSYFKIIKVSQTIADLTEAAEIRSEFIAEALQYRSNDD